MSLVAIPAVDLREGACVQLVGGRYEDERVRLEDPVGVARRWVSHGFRHLHVVDLDAATGRGDNATLIGAICRIPGLDVQVGGGVKTEERIRALLDGGAARAVVGTRALEDRPWLEEMALKFPGKLVVAADVRERRVVTRGWARTLPVDLADALAALNTLPLAGALVTAVHVEGKMQGPDLPLMGEAAQVCRAKVYASGGITTLEDLRALDARGVFGAVIGMAIYTGALDAAAAAREFGGQSTP